jgi:hypothetical protein
VLEDALIVMGLTATMWGVSLFAWRFHRRARSGQVLVRSERVRFGTVGLRFAGPVWMVYLLWLLVR